MLLMPRSRYVAAAGGGITDPSTDDPSIYAWWDASDAASVSVSVTNVTGVSDQLGTYDFAGFNSPQYVTAAQNGLNVIHFDAAGAETQELRDQNFTPPSGDFALHGAANILSVDDAGEGLFAFNGTSIKVNLLTGNTTQFDGTLSFGGGAGGTNGAFTNGPFSGFIKWTVIFDFTNSLWYARVNKTPEASAALSATFDSSEPFRWGTNISSNRVLDHYACELVVTEDITTATADAYHDYFDAKWA